MKHFLLIILLYLLSKGNAQEVLVIQINAKWNKSNTVDLHSLHSCKYIFAWLEDQPPQISQTVSSVPTIVVYRDKVPIQQYAAGLDLKLHVTTEEVQRLVNACKYDQ